MVAEKLHTARFYAIILLGPLVGSLFLASMGLIIDQPQPGFDLVTYLWLITAFGFMLGLVPASIAALVYRHVYPRLTTTLHRVIGAILIGFLCASLGLLLQMGLLSQTPSPIAPVMVVLVGITGSVALIAFGVPWRRRRKPISSSAT